MKLVLGEIIATASESKRRVFMRRCVILVAILASTFGHAFEIEKSAYFVGDKMKFFWWPKLTVPSGWAADEDLSIDLKANVLVPTGKTFATAEAVMYARAFTRTDQKAVSTLQKFIDGDIKEMKAKQKGLQVAKNAPVKTRAGQELVCYSFTVTDSSYERVLYGKEGDYWIMFVLSANSDSGLKKNLPIFEKMIFAYK